MPIHLAIGANYLSGTVTLNNAKKGIISFSNPFNKVPRILLNLLDNSVVPAYTTSVTKTGFNINFTVPFTGQVEWSAIER